MYSPSVTKTTVVFDAALKCLTLAYKQNKSNNYIIAMQQDQPVAFLQNVTIFTLRIIFKN